MMFRRHPAPSTPDEEGSILLAMLGLLSLTSIMLVLLAAILSGVNVSRHDAAFEQSLHAAEEGMDLLVAQVRQAPLSSSYPAATGTDSTTKATYTASAAGGSGHWVVTAVGTATSGGKKVTRTITRHVDTTSLLSTPLVGKDRLNLGGPSGSSGVERYDSSASSAVCDTSNLPLGLGTLLAGAGAHMCQTATPALGSAMTEGPLTMSGTDVNNVSQVDIYDAPATGYTDPAALGRCVGDSNTCSSSKVVTHQDDVDLPLSSLCSKGIGAGAVAYDGSTALAANAVYNFTDVTLNATAIANLSNPGATQMVICFSGTLVIPPAVALNTTVGSVVPLRLDPRPPAMLLLISTSNATTQPVVDFGLDPSLGVLSSLPSSISAVVYAPNAACKAGGHVDVYGAVICDTIDAANGLSVHYDTQLGLTPFDSTVVTSQWHEVVAGP